MLALAASVLMVIPAAGWQRQVSALMGMPGPSTASYLRTLVLAAVIGGLCVAVARLLIDLIKTHGPVPDPALATVSDELALFIGTAIVVVLVITLINGVLLRGFLAGANRVFQPQNATTMAGVVQPLERERSGSPESFAPWDTLGYQGRSFVGTGPHAAELTRINGRPAKEPVRVYVGLQTADTDEARMAVLLSELERSGAFERKVLVIAPTTGTGWINPVAARSLEMMYNGDTAIVGAQYSYLPSWISFLGDQQKSVESGRMLIDAVQQRWAQLPPDRRPRLLLYGESLGSMAGQGAFSWLPDISRMGFSSVLWVGPPNESRLWHGLTVRRDPGTPEVQPRYDNGRTVRFSMGNNAAQIAEDAAPPWEGTRVLFLQHPSDPIVWWSQDLLFNRPDWLSEPPGRDRTAVDAVVSDRHVLAGRRRHDQCDVGARRARTQLRRQRPRRLGGRRRPARMDAGRHRTDPYRHARDGGRRRGPIVRATVRAGMLAAALLGWSVLTQRIPPRWHPLPHAAFGTALAVTTDAPLGLTPPALRAGLRWGSLAAASVAVLVAASTTIPAVRNGMAARTLPDSTARWLLLRIPLGTVWPEEAGYRAALGSAAARAFGPARGRLFAAAVFGLSHVPDARAAGEPVAGTVAVTGAAGWIFSWLYEKSGSLAAPLLTHLAVNEAGAVAALMVQRRRRRHGLMVGSPTWRPHT